MTMAFKRGARVPHGVTPEAILAELDEIEQLYGRKSPETAAEAVLKDPDRFPALRAFCPDTPEQAYREAVRNAVTYAVRIIVEVDVTQPDPVEIRVWHLVVDADGPKYETLAVITSDEKLRLQLIDELRKDAEAFTSKMRNVLAEISRLLGG